jgi:steroid delta-isomerase
MATIYTEDAYFKDPFNEVRRVEDIQAIFTRMFEALEGPRFVVINRICEGDQAMLEWDFHFRIRSFRPSHAWCIHGVSHLRLSADGRVCHHRDFWDTGEELYARLPGIGAVVRFLRRRMA